MLLMGAVVSQFVWFDIIITVLFVIQGLVVVVFAIMISRPWVVANHFSLWGVLGSCWRLVSMLHGVHFKMRVRDCERKPRWHFSRYLYLYPSKYQCLRHSHPHLNHLKLNTSCKPTKAWAVGISPETPGITSSTTFP